MDLENVERLLERKESVGFRKPTDDPDYLGWIVLRKVKAHQRMLEILTPEDEPELVAEELRRQHEPYLLMRMELKRSVHEGGGYETEADYRQKERFWFPSLEAVQEKLSEWGYSLSDAKGSWEIDAP